MQPGWPEPSDRVLELAAAGKKIDAIKLYREESGLKLHQAKDVVDSLDGPSRPTPTSPGVGKQYRCQYCHSVLTSKPSVCPHCRKKNPVGYNNPLGCQGCIGVFILVVVIAIVASAMGVHGNSLNVVIWASAIILVALLLIGSIGMWLQSRKGI